MKRIYIIILIVAISCKEKAQFKNGPDNEIVTLTTEDYVLEKADHTQALLILFPGGGATSKQTKENFNITDKATKNNISVLFMNFNRHFWVDDDTSKDLAKLIEDAINKYDLKPQKIVIGGMSIGGNVALDISDYLTKINSKAQPQGVFVVDAPIDLFAMYESAQKDLKNKNLTEERLQEPNFIANFLEDQVPDGTSILNGLEKISPIVLKSGNISNINNLSETKLRFYTEPDTLWWQETRGTKFESTNAYILQRTEVLLNKKKWRYVSLIQTEDKGYRADGSKNPHSWSIVDKDDLIKWILE
ncbi:hypothetical protein SAMN05192588_0668 [Nonlabens sp. Hel1_33_55]|uniref:hypothetical protein n=1 Tax=Nonlabens sp. Hel1_33_55 TaxID=1336802 RepID=UPI000875BC77|nr:hypothetical protein [Nonlabens sp. Hel1_33_55]SCY00133.1 hypothetical protein SAMN05192588_0668 [Nonlabens sp. Hel1_33_55]